MRRLALAALLTALVAAPAATADESPIVGRGELVSGRDLTAWTIAWNRWRLSFPSKSDRACISDKQAGPVWFLSGGTSVDGHVISIDCTVPAGRYLMTGLPETLCTDVLPGEAKTTTDRGLARCARKMWRAFGDPQPRLVLDGMPIPSGYLVHTHAFRFTMPARGNVFGRRGIRGGRVAAAGRPAIVKPLARGRHTLIQGIKYRGIHNQVVIYNLDVV